MKNNENAKIRNKFECYFTKKTRVRCREVAFSTVTIRTYEIRNTDKCHYRALSNISNDRIKYSNDIRVSLNEYERYKWMSSILEMASVLMATFVDTLDSSFISKPGSVSYQCARVGESHFTSNVSHIATFFFMLILPSYQKIQDHFKLKVND